MGCESIQITITCLVLCRGYVQCNGYEVRIVLDQHALLDFDRASSLKEQTLVGSESE